jgi:YidC/Oxa1 family membrane protein insertase
MTQYLYNIIIFPLVQIFELSFLFIYRIFKNPGLALCGVSFAVTLLTLPLYFKAEYWQSLERGIQKKLKPKIDTIRAVFKGDERYMILSAFYRQNHWHPVYALRSSFGLLIQIPFFIAAYIYISNLGILNGCPFFIIKDLGATDALFSTDGLIINVLPVLMTVINVIAALVYTKGFPVKEKIQLLGTALVFLLLLYNSPAGLVLYWTANNVFSLAKNIIQKCGISFKGLFIVIVVFIALFDIYILFFHGGYILKRLLLFLASVLVLTYLFLWIKKGHTPPPIVKKNHPGCRRGIFWNGDILYFQF